MNLQLLCAVRDQIDASPASWDQRVLGDNTKYDDGSWQITHCIGGWAVVLSGGTPSDFDFPGRARHLLGLSSEEAENLFYEMDQDKARRYLDKLIDEARAEAQATEKT